MDVRYEADSGGDTLVGEFRLAPAQEMSKRAAAAREFYGNVIDSEEGPTFVADDATVYDICTLEDQELRRRILFHYGVEVTDADLGMKFWKLLDRVAELRRA